MTYLPLKTWNTNGINTTLRGATLQKIVEKMTPADRKERDADFINDILTGYPCICKSVELLDMLISRYRGPPSDDYADLKKYTLTLDRIQSR